MALVESITLFFCAGTSDKQYRLDLISERSALNVALWTVKAAFGRRGTLSQVSLKCDNSTEFVARQTFRRVIEEKLEKGYKVELVTKYGPTIRDATGASVANARAVVARAVVRASTPTTPRAPRTLPLPASLANALANALAKPKPKPAAPEVFGPTKRKIRLEGE